LKAPPGLVIQALKTIKRENNCLKFCSSTGQSCAATSGGAAATAASYAAAVAGFHLVQQPQLLDAVVKVIS
jgi:hypothetical protein